MARSLLNTLSTVEIVVIFVFGSVVLAIGLAIAIRKLVPDIAERQFEELASGLRVVYELLFALILAFVIASVLDKFNDAESTVGAEATALSQMQRDNLAFPTATQDDLNVALTGYVTAVVKDEWPAMREGNSSLEADAALETLYAAYAAIDPQEGAATEFFNQALAHLDEVAAARRDRLALANAKLPTFLVVMLPIGVVLLLILEYRPRLGNRSQAGFMGTLALVLSSTYLLTIVLDYPFSGDVTVSSEPLTAGGLAAFVGTIEPDRRRDERAPPRNEDLAGVWSSDAYGTVALRTAHGGRELHGVYRASAGTVRGSVFPDGVFRGVWCEGPTRKPSLDDDSGDAGLVEWRLSNSAGGPRLTGTWSYGYERRPAGGFEAAGAWNMLKLRIDEARDLQRRLDREPESAYCRAPGER